MLLFVVSFLLFVATSAKPAGREDFVYPTVKTLRNGEKRMRIRALDQDIELRLEPAGDTIADDFALIDANGKRYHHSIDIERLKRKLYRDKKNGAALLIDEDGPLHINGIVSREIRIKPDDTVTSVKSGIKAHRIVEEKFDRNTFVPDGILGLSMENRRDFNPKMKRRENNKCIVVEILFITDSYFTHRFDSTESLTEYVTLRHSQVQDLLETLDLGIKSRMIGIIAYQNGSEPAYIEECADPYLMGHVNPFTLLGKLSDYVCENSDDNEYIKRSDLIMLFSDRGFVSRAEDGSPEYKAAGVAYIGQVCNKCYKVGVINHYSVPELITHEIGHILGSPEDGGENCPSVGHIMSGLGKPYFSNCSRHSVENHIFNKGSSGCIFEDCTNEDDTNKDDEDDVLNEDDVDAVLNDDD